MTIEIAQRWFETKRIDDDITLLWEPHVVSLMRCNIWHVRGRDRDLMIDTGMGIASLREAARHLLDKSVTAVATHVHADRRRPSRVRRLPRPSARGRRPGAGGGRCHAA